MVKQNMINQKQGRVAVGLSGGVDSSVAAALLIEQGYDVTGVYLTCWSGPGCRSEDDRKDALDIALQLGISFEHLDFQKAYRGNVYEFMVREYEAGRTPNPDVVCNREIKFGLFYQWALRQGFDFVATGHYAQVGNNNQKPVFCDARLPQAGSGCASQKQNFCLLQAEDKHKDQTYFLYQLEAEQLAHILFPIGHLTKTEVRQEAKRRGLLTADKPDSVGICFIGEVPMQKFLAERIQENEGEIVLRISNNEYRIVNKHKGIHYFTIGQKISIQDAPTLKQAGFDTRNLPHFYVVDKDVEKNILYVGTEEQLEKHTLTIGEIHWIGEQSGSQEVRKLGSVMVRIRHTGELIPIVEYRIENHEYRIKLAKPVKGVAPGQVAVLYQDKRCLGGGILE